MNNALTMSPRALPRLLGLAALTVALASTSSLADDYRDVNQLLRSGKYADALGKADQYLAAKPRDPQMRFLKGVIQTEAGKTADAISTFQKLTDEYPELPEPFNNLAVLYANQGHYDKARAALEMAIRNNPSYATAHENLGDVYAKLASLAYSKALQLDSNNPSLRPKLAIIRELFSAPSAKPGSNAAGNLSSAQTTKETIQGKTSAQPGTGLAASSPARANSVSAGQKP